VSGIRYDPLRYGLELGKYRVRHFGHSTQWRTRDMKLKARFDRNRCGVRNRGCSECSLRFTTSLIGWSFAPENRRAVNVALNDALQ
jgi:hypothetical protein